MNVSIDNTLALSRAGTEPAAPLRTTDPAAAREAAQEFEAVFISQTLAQMFADIDVDPVFGGGHAEEIFRGMLIEEYGREISKAGGFGLADAIMREILVAQEGASS